MVSEACCNRDRTQAVFPVPVIPAVIEVKGCLEWNRRHFICENIGTVWNRVRPALRCLDITHLFILSFLLKDFSQKEQTEPTHGNSSGAKCRLKISENVAHLYRFSVHKILSFSLLLLLSLLISFIFPPPPQPPPHSIVFYPSPTRFISCVATPQLWIKTYLQSVIFATSNLGHPKLRLENLSPLL